MRLEVTRWIRKQWGDWDCIDATQLTIADLDTTVEQLNKEYGPAAAEATETHMSLTWQPTANTKVILRHACN